MLYKKLLTELKEIKKELQAIKKSMEPVLKENSVDVNRQLAEDYFRARKE